MNKYFDSNHLDASLEDFRAPLTPPPTQPSSFDHCLSTHSGFAQSDSLHMEDLDDQSSVGDDSLSAGGYSPPAWRRLENGDRSAGFWRPSNNLLGLGRHHSHPGYFDGVHSKLQECATVYRRHRF